MSEKENLNIVDENGVIRGVDKEQSFRYLRDPDSEKPSCDYSPNWSYGTQEPIYNLIFRRYSEGKLNSIQQIKLIMSLN